MAKVSHWRVFAETPQELTDHGQYVRLAEAMSRFTSLIGEHVMNDDAEPKDFRVIEYRDNRTNSVIEQYEFKGFRTAPEEKDPNRPMYCPMCDTELNLIDDVEQWSDATIVYKVVGVYDDGLPEWGRDREDIDENGYAHRVFCNHCGDAMPLDEWNEAYENRP